MTTSTNLIKHIRTQGHEELLDEYERLSEIEVLNGSNKKRGFKRKLEDAMACDSPLKTLDGHFAKQAKYSLHSCVQNERRTRLTKMLVKCMLPITIVDNENFKEYINYLDPSFTIPQAYTVKHTVLKELTCTVYENLIKKIDTMPHINIALDLWSDATCRGFNGINIHGIDNNWQMCKHSICFEYLGNII